MTATSRMTDLSWAKPKQPQKRKRSEARQVYRRWLVDSVGCVVSAGLGHAAGRALLHHGRRAACGPGLFGRTVRIAGAVDGESIDYDSERAVIRFEIVDIPSEYDDLATALREALMDDSAPRLRVVVEDAAIPDLLQHEAQAILTGALGGDALFQGTELLLKCPSRFEESAAPEALSQIPEHK